ncbi:MAG: LPS export ABC transporter ATP-binding protein [Magnetococcales bacterium]|nr:LPS export ABC transporter ATP-binding protein [Magnetococcales bacterium]
MAKQQRLEARGICKLFRGRPVVDQVDLTVAPGEVVGLLGPNGAGKTTTFYILTGLIAPDRGTIWLNEQDITSEPIYRRARMGISYLPQEPSVFRRLTVRDNILAILETRPLDPSSRMERLETLLEDLGVAHVAHLHGYALSGGERRRVEVARALAIEPCYVLLDEPFAGVDPLAVEDIQAIIRHLKQRGIGVLITDHNVRETLGICDRACIMAAGRVLASGHPDQIVRDQHVRQRYLGDRFHL